MIEGCDNGLRSMIGYSFSSGALIFIPVIQETERPGFLLSSHKLFQEFLAAHPEEYDEKMLEAFQQEEASLQASPLQKPSQQGPSGSKAAPASSETKAMQAQSAASPSVAASSAAAPTSRPASSGTKASSSTQQAAPAAIPAATSAQGSKKANSTKPQDASKPAQQSKPSASAQSSDSKSATGKQYTSEQLIERLFRAVERFPWQAPPKLVKKVAEKLPDKPGQAGGEDAKPSWHLIIVEKEAAFKRLMSLLEDRRDVIEASFMDIRLDPELHDPMAGLLKGHKEHLVHLHMYRNSLNDAAQRQLDLQGQTSDLNRHCAAIEKVVAHMAAYERNMHLLLFQRLKGVSFTSSDACHA